LNKILSTRTNVIFLTAILVTGTIVLSVLSFITINVQAVPNYGKEDNNKCIDVNLNLPGLDFNSNPPTEEEDIVGLASLAHDGEGNNGPSNGFKSFDKVDFTCINANDNSVRGGIDRDKEEPEPSIEPSPEPETCEECFLQNLDGIDIAAILPINLGGGGQTFDTREELCNFIKILRTEQDKIFMYNQLAGIMLNTPTIDDEEAEAVLDCLERLGLVILP
jgi:hypothetical protein